MYSVYVTEIATPNRITLRGLWFGPKKARKIVVWVHGLAGSAFSGRKIVRLLAGGDTAVLTFNNRGHDSVTRVSKVGKGGKKKSFWAGSAHEVFTECLDDIQGAISFVKRQGAKKEIYLAGHSTGCQKSVYWASKTRGGRGVKGIILLAPVSDYAGAVKKYGKGVLARAAHTARALVRARKPHELLPSKIWSDEPCDAQRFISLYTPDSVEEIFSYSQPRKHPKVFKSVNVPILTLWAGKDEYADRPPEKVEEWFKQTTDTKILTFSTIKDASHGFRGKEKVVVRIVRKWMQASKK